MGSGVLHTAHGETGCAAAGAAALLGVLAARAGAESDEKRSEFGCGIGACPVR